MISAQFTAQAEEVPYPYNVPREQRDAARAAYDVAKRAVTTEFAAALAETYLSDIAESRRAVIAEHAFRLAWEHGHASGYGDVESYYQDFANFAQEVYSVATS